MAIDDIFHFKQWKKHLPLTNILQIYDVKLYFYLGETLRANLNVISLTFFAHTKMENGFLLALFVYYSTKYFEQPIHWPLSAGE